MIDHLRFSEPSTRRNGVTHLVAEDGSTVLVDSGLTADKRSPDAQIGAGYVKSKIVAIEAVAPARAHSAIALETVRFVDNVINQPVVYPLRGQTTMDSEGHTSSDHDPRGDAPRAFRVPHESDRSPTSPSYTQQTLSTARRIGVMGDLHGDLEHALQVSQTLAARDIQVLLQLGDFGVLWPGRQNWMIDLNKLSRTLSRNRQSLFFVDGNHDWHPRLLEFPVSEDGIRWIASNVGHLPRGYRTQIGGRFSLAALGGANSPDRGTRTAGKDWWPEEQISEADLQALGYGHADILVGHESPLPDAAEDLRQGLSPQDATYAHGSRRMFRRAVLQTRPLVTLGGHYHRHVDEMITAPANPPFQTRVVVLDMNGKNRINLAILDAATLELEFLYRNGATANEGSR